MNDNEATQLPATRSKRLRLFAATARVGSYCAPALATVLLFFAKGDRVWFWWAAGALATSIALQLAKDWWERVLRTRRGPDARALDIILAQQALTSAGQMSSVHSRREALGMCRQHLVRALAQEYEEWEGSVVILYLHSGPPITVSIGTVKYPPPLSTEATRSPYPMSYDVYRAKSFISAPVSMAGHIWGMVVLQTSEMHTLSAKDGEIVQKYAAMLALTFEVISPAPSLFDLPMLAWLRAGRGS